MEERRETKKDKNKNRNSEDVYKGGRRTEGPMKTCKKGRRGQRLYNKGWRNG